MKKYISALLCAVLLLLAACGSGGTQKMAVYRCVSPYDRTDGELLCAETVDMGLGVGPISSLISAFNSAPTVKHAVSPLPSGGLVTGYGLYGGTLELKVTGCGQLSPAELALLHCCAALTFCQLENVSAVSLSSDGEELAPPLRVSDILLADTAGK